MGLISELTLGHHHVAGLSQMVFAQGLQWRGSMGYTILRHIWQVLEPWIPGRLQKKMASRKSKYIYILSYHIIYIVVAVFRRVYQNSIYLYSNGFWFRIILGRYWWCWVYNIDPKWAKSAACFTSYAHLDLSPKDPWIKIGAYPLHHACLIADFHGVF